MLQIAAEAIDGDADLTSSTAEAAGCDYYDDLTSLYDDLDEHAVNPYEGLEKSESSPVVQPRATQATNDYTTLGALKTHDTRKTRENIEMGELPADPDAVSQPLANSSINVIVVSNSPTRQCRLVFRRDADMHSAY